MEGTLDQHKAEMYGICALLDFLMWPWTILIIAPTNKKLFKRQNQRDEARSDEAVGKTVENDGQGEESTHQLVQHWGNLNIVRAFFPLVSSLLGIWATVS